MCLVLYGEHQQGYAMLTMAKHCKLLFLSSFLTPREVYPAVLREAQIAMEFMFSKTCQSFVSNRWFYFCLFLHEFLEKIKLSLIKNVEK